MLNRLLCANLLLCGGLSVGFAGCREPSAPANSAPVDETIELAILTPHAEPIREAFADGFRRWQVERQLQTPITLRWLAMGTVECQRFIQERYGQHPGSPSSYIGVDLFFGGSAAIHQSLAERGYARSVNLPDAVIAGIPAELNGVKLYADDHTWHGTSLGGLGIMFNRQACEARGVPLPQSWSDLAKPAYAGWIAAADPSLSGSTTQCMALVLHKHGWDEGWGMLTAILANTNGLLPSSTYIAPNISSGVSLAGFEPEFVARMAIAAQPESLDYINPPGATTITPDVITVLQGTRQPKSADAFVEFVLSEKGQALWALPPDVDDGPPSEPLYRYPIRPEIFTKYGDQLLVKGNPFAEHTDFKYEATTDQAYTVLLPLLIQAACGKNHLALQQSWRKAVAASDEAALVTLRQPPFDQAAALAYAKQLAEQPQEAEALLAAWSKLFAERYQPSPQAAAP